MRLFEHFLSSVPIWPIGSANFIGRPQRPRENRADQSKFNDKETSCIYFLYTRRLRYCDVEVFKMLNILNHCKKVVPSLLLAQLTDFKSVCPAAATRGYSLCSLQILTGTVVSSRRCSGAQASGTKRYSEKYTQCSIVNSNVDVLQKELHVMDTDSSLSKWTKQTNMVLSVGCC